MLNEIPVLLTKIKAGDLMTDSVLTTEEGTTCLNALQMMAKKNVGSVVVLRRGTQQAFVYQNDVIGLAPVFFTMRGHLEDLQSGAKEASVVDSVMIRELIFAHMDQNLAAIIPRIVDNKSWRLIILDDYQKIVGLISATDIFKILGNCVKKEREIKIGKDSTFYNLDFLWKGKDLLISRKSEFVTSAKNVRDLVVEEYDEPASSQKILLMRFTCEEGERLLFIDADPVQTNAREVSPSLQSLKDVYDWLLSPDYAYRHGDVGVYARDTLPVGCQSVSPEKYEAAFEPVLSLRHVFKPAANCEFFVTKDRYFCRIGQDVQLMHPEHAPEALEPGLYEIIAARGVALPNIVGLREGERLIEAV